MALTHQHPADYETKVVIAVQHIDGEHITITPQTGKLVADLICAETVRHDPEASEQLDLLAAIVRGYIHPVTAHGEPA